jgi:hypothetical protein
MTRAMDNMHAEISNNREGWRLLLQSQRRRLENRKVYEVHLVAGSQSVKAKALAGIDSVTIPIDDMLIKLFSTADVLGVMGAGATLTVPLDSAAALAQLGARLSGSNRAGVNAIRL